MVEPADADEVAEAMYGLVVRARGVKKIAPRELMQSAELLFGNRADKKTYKEAIRVLIDSGRCVYTYFGSTAIEIPSDEEDDSRMGMR